MTIDQWLQSGQDYPTGVKLYEKHGSSLVYKRMFAKSQTRYNREKLAQLLRELLANQSASSKEQSQSLTIPADKPKEDSKVLAEQLKARWRPLYKRMSHLHAQLVHVNQTERGTMAFEILSLEQQINTLWKQEKYIQTYGQLPEKAVIESTKHDLSTESGIQKRILNLRTLISKHRNNARRAEEVEKWQVEKHALEQKSAQLSHEKDQV